ILTAVASVQFFCLMGVPILAALYLIEIRELNAGFAGLLIAALAVASAVFSPLGGWVADRLSYKIPLIIGMSTVTSAAGLMLFWENSTSHWFIAVTLILMGLGMSFTQSPSAAGITLVVNRDSQGVALGIFHMLRFIGGTLSATIFGYILGNAQQNRPEQLQSLTQGFYLLIAVAISAVIFCLIMPAPPSSSKSMSS
ncbi:MAG: MFS transporter, partial [Chloroflexota bacterium]